MNKTHKKLLLPFVMLLSAPHNCSANWFDGMYTSLFGSQTRPTQYEQTFTDREARSYVEQSIASLERALARHMRPTDLTNLKRLILDNVTRAQYAYQSSSSYFSSGKKYKKDVIDQFLSSAVITYIEETSYNYVLSRTYDRTMATRISSSMRNNALAIIAQNSVINYERLVPFVGYALEKALNNMLKDNDPYNYNQKPAQKPAKPIKPEPNAPKLFRATDCIICLDEFNETDVQRIDLSCGHDMCKTCVFEYFFGVSGKTICPQCRKSVDRDKLQDELLK